MDTIDNTENSVKVYGNYIKSDVYSLGITLIYLCKPKNTKIFKNI